MAAVVEIRGMEGMTVDTTAMLERDVVVSQSPTKSDSGSEYSQPLSPHRSRPASQQTELLQRAASQKDESLQTSKVTISQPPSRPISVLSSHSSIAAGSCLSPTTLEPSDELVTVTPKEEIDAEMPFSKGSRQVSQQTDKSSEQDSTEQDTRQLLTPEHPKTSSPLSVITVLPQTYAAAPPRPNSSTSPTSSYSVSPTSASPPQTPSKAISPMTPREARMSADSFASIALSETSLDYDHLSSQRVDDVLATPRVSGIRHTRKPSSLEILQSGWGPPSRQSTLFDIAKDEPLQSPLIGGGGEDADDEYKSNPEYGTTETMSMQNPPTTPSIRLVDSESMWRRTEDQGSGTSTPKRKSGSSSEVEIEVDWHALDKNEEQEKEDKDLPEGAEDESTAFLLARLEQENAKFAADPMAGVTINKTVQRIRSKSRPPSLAHLKKLVESTNNSSARYSIVPDVTMPEEPPPMTELEFWTALVQDYPSTAARLPTLTTTKIRAGIPPPLRGVVWTSMAGARDRGLEDAFESLQDEKSPYEGIINKDVGRSFPGVELFRDAEGEGQKMLGRVLKCYSLHDKDIGYCQGLGFLVGPLLMNMGEREAFCVLVRLMDHYALRPSFLPSLSGLHMRIYQFSTLLAQHHPQLSEHLNSLGVEPAYLSQWFLSCFAVTCPLPMLFRIYDVIFAEGANETVMRVALALFRRNEKRMLESTEFEEVMQLLLGRALWDCYGSNPDELVDDFTSLGNVITHQRLAELEREFENQSTEAVGRFAGFLPDVQAAASRFLGRLWAPSHGHTPSKSTSTLSPQSAEKETSVAAGLFANPGSFLRRSPSKPNIHVLTESNDSESSTTSGSASLTSTAPTDSELHDMARESQVDSMSVKSTADSMRTVSVTTTQISATAPGVGKEQQELYGQIEDLLMALSEAQREHVQLAAMLHMEREERNDDHRVVKQLVKRLRKDHGKGQDFRKSMPPALKKKDGAEGVRIEEKRQTLPPRPRPQMKDPAPLPETKPIAKGDLSDLLDQVQSRLESNARFSASFETKAQLRSALTRTREQLVGAQERIKDLTDRAEFSETSLQTFQNESESLRAEVEELRVRVNDEFKTRQNLELQLQGMEMQIRLEAGSTNRSVSMSDVQFDARGGAEAPGRKTSIASAPPGAAGLRELRLGRRDSVGSISSIRSMKSQRAETPRPGSPGISVSPSPTEVHEPEASPMRVPPTPTPAPTAQRHGPSASLTVPLDKSVTFARRTSSLATQAVLATPKHELVSEEALLLELVNAKTAEAQARQEVDELKRNLSIQKRRTDETLAQTRTEIDALRTEAERAREEARLLRLDVERDTKPDLLYDASSPLATPVFSLPPTPAVEEMRFPPTAVSESASPSPMPERADTKKTDPPAVAPTNSTASTVGGWFWGRRTASTNKAVVE